MSFSVGYGPYGEAYGTSGTADLSFTGQNQDMVTTYGGLYDFLYREYNPNQGRWVSPDPSGLGAVAPGDPQTWNRYAYVANNPLSNTDPQGLDCFIDGCGWWGMFPGGGGFPYPFLGYLPPQLLYGGGIGNGYGSGFDFNLDGDLGGMGSCGGENLGMPCGMLPLATSPGQALQSLWADAFGLPTFDCPTSQGPWCNGQSPVSPIMDAFNPWQQQCTNDAYGNFVQSMNAVNRKYATGWKLAWLGALGAGFINDAGQTGMNIPVRIGQNNKETLNVWNIVGAMGTYTLGSAATEEGAERRAVANQLQQDVSACMQPVALVPSH